VPRLRADDRGLLAQEQRGDAQGVGGAVPELVGEDRVRGSQDLDEVEHPALADVASLDAARAPG